MSARRKAPVRRAANRKRSNVPQRRPVTVSREGAILVAGAGCILALAYNVVTGMMVVLVAFVVYMLDFAGRRQKRS